MLAIATAPRRDSLHWKQEAISWADLVSWVDAPAKTKACGNYVLGTLNSSTVKHKASDKPCTGLHRTKMAIASRDAVTLDADAPDSDFIVEALSALEGSKALIHTTFNSTPDSPRYRVIVPLDRPVAPDEYHAIAAALMLQIGEDQFDQGSVEPERYMFKPSAKAKGDFQSWVLEGGLAKADELLAGFNPDLSALPLPNVSRWKRDPFAIEGTIGAFNRAYESFEELIEAYELPYELVSEGRWQLAGAVAAAGVSEIAPGLIYSHHANDPAHGSAQSAFDLARLHLYGHLDESAAANVPVNRLPSHKAMLETATEDLKVVQELVGDVFTQELEGTAEEVARENWKLDLVIDPKTGEPRDTIRNWDLIVKNDPAFSTLYRNEMSLAVECSGDLPWREVGSGTETFRADDRASLALYIEREYRIRPGRAYLDDLINDATNRRRVNPMREYLKSLEWDGISRIETALPGVKPTPYTRMVARKSLVAAVARMMEPGIKWDHMLVLFGKEGLGKSYWVEAMSKGYSAELERLQDKDTLITMQRSWIMTSDEGQSMKKSDFDTQKAFITRTADVFRMPYEREAQEHKRHCVIWGTTNDEVFLRRQEGNRRFLIVHCEERVNFDLLTPEYVDQVWAEAMVLFNRGEKLFIEGDEAELAKMARERFTEEDALTGVIQEFLDTLVPDNWDDMSPESRQLWYLNQSDGFSEGTKQISETCSLQIWVEALGRRRGEHRRIDLLEITEAMNHIEGWAPSENRKRLPGYGPQKYYYRLPPAPTAEDFEDLI